MDSPDEARLLDCALTTSVLELETTSVKDPATMTIEFLRARLLSERSVSKAVREHADQLMKKVAELECQLQSEIQLRKRLEATRTDALSNYKEQLEGNHGQLFHPSCLSELYKSDEDTAAAFRRPAVSYMQDDMDRTEKNFSVISENLSASSFQDSAIASFNSEMEKTEFPMHKSDLIDEGHIGSNDDDNHDQAVREKGMLAWGKRKGVKKLLDKDVVECFGRSFSQKSITSGDGESPHKRWAGKSVRQLRKKENRIQGASTEEEASQAAYQHALEIKDIDADREMEVERVPVHLAELIEQFEAEEYAQREWEDNFKEQNAFSFSNHHQDVGDTLDMVSSMETNPPRFAEQSQLEENSNLNLKDGLTEPLLDRQPDILSDTNTEVDRHTVDAGSQTTGESAVSATREEAVDTNTLGIDQHVFSELDVAMESHNNNSLKKDEMGLKAQNLEDKAEGCHESSVELETSHDNQVTIDDKGSLETKTTSLGDPLGSIFLSRFQAGMQLDMQQSTNEDMGRNQSLWENKSVDGTGHENPLQTKAASLGGMSSATVLNRSHVELGDLQHKAGQQRLRSWPSSWGIEALEDEPSQGSLDNPVRDISMNESFQQRTRTVDLSHKHNYGTYKQKSDSMDRPVEKWWYGQSASRKHDNIPSLPFNKRQPHDTVPAAYAFGHGGPAFVNQHKSVDGGFDRVADVLHALQMAKQEMERPQLLSSGYNRGFDGREALYAEPHYPSVYPTSRQLDNDFYTVPFSSRYPARQYGPDHASWSLPRSYFADSARQHVAYAPYRSGKRASGHYWPPPEYGYVGQYHGGDPRDQR